MKKVKEKTTKKEVKVKEPQQIQQIPQPGPLKLTPKIIKEQVDMVQELYENVMKRDKHYGVIPGCGDKPTLLKPGAEMLVLMFQLAPKIKELEKTDLPNGHREYEMTIALFHKHTGEFWGDGTGMCTTMESKYRYRKGSRKCPECGKETIIKGKSEYGGGWLCWKKKGGCGFKFEENDARITSQVEGRVENEDLADTYNTVKKMCKKRTMVDAVLSVTAVSNIFTQDIEEIKNQNGSPESNGKPSAPPEEKKEEKKAPEKKEAPAPAKKTEAQIKEEVIIRILGLLKKCGCHTTKDAIMVAEVNALNDLKSFTLFKLDGLEKKLIAILERDTEKEDSK